MLLKTKHILKLIIAWILIDAKRIMQVRYFTEKPIISSILF